MPSGFLIVLPFLVLAPITIYWHAVWRPRRAREILESWAQANGLQILESEIRWFFKPPFLFIGRSKVQLIFRVTVQSADGMIRHGWALVGDWIIGLWSEQVQVKWDPDGRGFPVLPVDSSENESDA